MPVIHVQSVFGEMVLLLLIAAAAGVVAMRLRQPPIIGFIAVGILAGPSVFNLIRSTEEIHLLAEMGMSLLLFIVGLKLDIGLIRQMGTVTAIIGIGQVVITTATGYLICLALGTDSVTALYLAAALTFSSTVIIIKLLSDRNEADSLHGRIILGLLIAQDIIVVLVMVFLSAFSGGRGGEPVLQAVLIGLKGAGLIAAAWLLSVLIAPRLLRGVAKSSEMLVLTGIVWAIALASAGELLGFSKEIGAFIAGVSLASTPYKDAISVRLSSLRDFLLLFFFIELGSRFDVGTMGSLAWLAIPLSLFVLIGKPVIVVGIAAAVGYRKRTSLLAGLTVGQVSEFSLILITMGGRFGHIADSVVGLVTLVAMVTIALSTYMIRFSENIYRALAPYLSVFQSRKRHREDADSGATRELGLANTLIFGLGSYGTGIGRQLAARGRRIVGVDFNPRAVEKWLGLGYDAVFGDARDAEMLRSLHLAHTKWVISSLRDREANSALLRALRGAGYTGRAAVTAYEADDQPALIEQGADLVFNPFGDAAVQAADLVFATEDMIARKAMDKLIDSMSGHYIVCGYGRMGQQIVKDLTRYNVPCVVVEWNPEQLPKLRENEVPHIEGKATEDASLLKAGIRRAKGLIAVAASDEENVFIVLTAKVLNPHLFIVARSILQENEDKLRHAGADQVMSPYVLGGRRMAAAVIRPEVMDFLDLVVHEDGGDAEMAIITVLPGSSCTGKTLGEVNPWEDCGVTVLAIRRRGEELHPNPKPDIVLQEGDELIVMGTPSDIESARSMLASPP